MDITVDLRLALEIALAIAASAIGWFLHVIIARLDRIENRVDEDAQATTALRVRLAEAYVTKEDHKSALDSIFGALRRIEDKIDKKADK